MSTDPAPFADPPRIAPLVEVPVEPPKVEKVQPRRPSTLTDPVKPLSTPKAPPAPKFGGYQVHVAGLGPWKAGDVVSAKDLTRANVDEDRLAQLKDEGVLSEVWS